MVVKISIQAAHEQVNPSDLLHDVIYMDQNGIERCWTSDHYMPWWNSGASGGAAWPWLGAALARTNKITIGTGVTAPILRYHPAIVAQVFATLGFMFPNRVFLGVGRGESLNEVTSGNQWPSNLEKFERLKEAVLLIKKLWTEDWVNFKGKYYWVKDSNLYTKPKTPIPLYIAGLGKQSAMLAGELGDGFVTNELSVDAIGNNLFPALKEGAKRAGKNYDSLEKILFIPASYDPNDKQKAIESIRFWRGAMIKAFFDVDVHDPKKIEENAQVIGDDTLENMLLIISNGADAIKKLQKYVDLGFTEIVLTNSSPDRDKLVKLVSDEIALYFRN
ncbi:MAG: TIGR03557 family F420-dependent LLM class oxidoreductase [Nitrososphaeraceae archaeon]|nr:TIGR03557 family F420-dependent LLM class oxidoreductase [Nitrososphaeraceae archaeon]MDW0185322.1 TIGR03557 family F420-dependent LLM class oxidoreductase [Nitrososphaeraceae archaeon]MDW0199365.1 TIGR03557 family F420-dependent LLM class oxidoreductase [Nitrososphaeraceae archaeon]MDW0216881.1 TIGR03557 family F420-dependent LLM class oxidoreductase [Nitrososphaeraceae archaeon]MDW0228755.1 TIGR03557 family F420-dependent LLM class oxidoreductase [Nitrososphaeraceae archaeon]